MISYQIVEHGRPLQRVLSETPKPQGSEVLGRIGVSLLRAKGVKGIVACDIDDAKLAAAAKLGAKRTVNTRDSNAADQVRGIAGALDFVGSPATAALGIGSLRKGGRYVICGLYGGELVHPLPPI